MDYSAVSRPSKTLLVLCALPVVLLLASYTLFLGHKIDLSSADIGRHLINGRVFIEQRLITRTNFYSYTAPDFPAPNHHWGSGAMFYLVWRATGFTGLHLFFIALSLAALLAFFIPAWRAAGAAPASLLGLAAIPLLAERTEIRPEVFSYLFAGLFYLVLSARRRTGGARLLWLLPIMEILWVNTHIYFFLGPCFVLAFLADDLVASWRTRRKSDPALLKIFAATVAAIFINPFGIAGAAAPLTVFRNYGYRVAENQPVWFLERLMRDPNYLIFKILFAALAVGFAARQILRPREERIPVADLMLGIGVSVMAWLAVRNFALFGFLFIPLAAAAAAPRVKSWCGKHAAAASAGAALAIAIIALPALSGTWQQYFPSWRTQGIGLIRNNGAADFLKTQRLRGPIFNNYDIGGFLIFHLFPDERVFTDNRPEAYPAAFFTDTYVPMQQDEDIWRRELERWRFNAIVFGYRDATPWAQTFLSRRIRDPEWAPVFADERVLIMLRRAPENMPVIRRFELPQEMFLMVPAS